MIELYINGQLVDTEPGEPIACTYQRNDIGELKDRQADYTNEFKLPLTNKNKIILGNPEVLQTQSIKPYKNNTARLLQDGIEIIGNGVAVIGNSSIEGYVSVTIFSGIFDLFAKLGDKDLKDVDFSDLNHQWSNTFAVGAKDNLTGVVYPLIKTEVADISDSTWNIATQVPSVFVRTIFEKIINQAGFSISGNFFLTTQYQNMIMPMLDTFERDEKWIKDRSSFVSFSPNDFTDFRGSTYGQDGEYSARIFPFSRDYGVVLKIEADGSTTSVQSFDGAKNNYNGAAFNYTADTPMIVNIELKFRVSINTSTFGDCNFKFSIRVNGNIIKADDILYTSDGEKTPLLTVQNYTLNTGDYIEVYHELIKNNGVGQPRAYFHLDTSLAITPTKVIAINSILDINSVIPAIKQKDFLKSILQQFAISIQFDNYASVLRFATFNEIAEKAPLDWSKKLDASKIDIKYRFDEYAKSNNLKYGKNTKETTVGNGEFIINDETIEIEKTVVDLPFAGTIEGNLFPQLFKVADLPIMNASLQRQKIEPRLLMLERNANWTGLTIMDGVNSNIVVNGNYPYAYFTKSGAEGLDFGKDLIPKYYQYLVDALDKCKIVTCYLNLNAIDIQNLDFFTPIYIEYFNAKFYINKIEDYTGYGSTKCELVRL